MEIGATIKDQYHVIEHIGRGGMADVWSARDERLQRLVAIKTISSSISDRFDPVTLFKQEAQTIAQMEHQHILPIYDFGEHENNLYIVMRYITGGSVEDVLMVDAIDPLEVLKMGDAIAKALDYAHDEQVIHLDLKPANILLDRARVPYLADFGLATALDPDGHARNPGSGTLLYMAPEQIIAKTLTKQVDIYSFSLMLYHMFTGQLPFEGSEPLAIRQLQSGDELPEISHFDANLPSDVTQILRQGTMQNPDQRYMRHGDIIDGLRAVLQPTIDVQDVPIEFDMYDVATGDEDAGLAEAESIYSKARHLWQGGNGRFLLGVSHYLLMADYYKNARQHQLTIDQQGYQMLLRGALEYDADIHYWWKQMGNTDRRWVCLHALRSGNPPARIRALERLEHLPESQNDMLIPRMVSQALTIETDERAKIAALRVLGTRAEDMERYDVTMDNEKIQRLTESGRVSSTLNGLGIQVSRATVWLRVVYSEEVDQLIAQTTFDADSAVAEFAARTVGRIRSLTAIELIATEQKNDRPGALDALALVRDETPALPAVVSPQARAYAWLTNTLRRLAQNPLDTIVRFLVVLLAGWIAMGEYVYSTFRSQALFDAQRWANTLAIGIVFGLFIALTYTLTNEVARRLRGFWSWWSRLLLFSFTGFLMGTLSYAGFMWLFLQFTPVWDLTRFAGFALAFALVGAAVLELRGWMAILFTAVVVYFPLLVAHHIYYSTASTPVIAIALFGLVIGAICGWRASYLSPISATYKLRLPTSAKMLMSAGAGVLWTGGVWLTYARLLDQIRTGTPITFDTLIILFLVTVASGTLATYWLSRRSGITFVLTAIASFVIATNALQWQFDDRALTVPVPPGQPAWVLPPYYDGVALSPAVVVRDGRETVRNDLQPIFHVDDLTQIYTIGIPMMIVIAIGANLQGLLLGWYQWVGKPKQIKERGGWLAFMLIYTLILTGMSSILALFSMKVDIAWALGWSLWAFITFVFALAAYRWAKWGADGLLASGVVFLVGGFVFDAVNMQYMAARGYYPPLLEQFTLDALGLTVSISVLVLWSLWSAVLGLFVWGAQQDQLWGAIGLALLLAGWYFVAIFTPIYGSMTVFAVTNVALMFFALKTKYHLMESERFQLPRIAWLQPEPETVPVMEADTEPPQAPVTKSPPTNKPGTQKLDMGTRLYSVEPTGTRPFTSADADEPTTERAEMPTQLGEVDIERSQRATKPVNEDMQTKVGVDDDWQTRPEPITDERPAMNEIPTRLGERDARVHHAPTQAINEDEPASNDANDAGDDEQTTPRPQQAPATRIDFDQDDDGGTPKTMRFDTSPKLDAQTREDKLTEMAQRKLARERRKQSPRDKATIDLADDQPKRESPKISLSTRKLRSKGTLKLDDADKSEPDTPAPDADEESSPPDA